MGWPKYQIGAIKGIRFFELVGFLAAYLILYAFIDKIECNKIEVAVVVFFISLIVIKTDLFFYYTNNLKKTIKNCLTTGKKIIIGIFKIPFLLVKFVKNIKFFSEIFVRKLKVIYPEIPRYSQKGLKYFTIIFKQIFFNVFYDIFPILLIWLSVTGLFVIFNIISIPGIKDNLNLILAFSISLGIFQYFLKRHEEKIYPKLSILPNKINAIIAKETEFVKFFDSIGNSLLKDKIKETIDPKLITLDLLRLISRDPEIKKMLSSRGKNKDSITLQTVFNSQYSSDQKYQSAETAVKKSNLEKELEGAYSNFFLSIAYENIIDKIEREVDINEYAILAQSNINIIQEVIPQFINLDLQNEFDNITNDSNIVTLPTETSAEAFKQHLREKINYQIKLKIFP